MITLKLKVGKAVVEVTGKNEKEVIEDASIFYEMPCSCGLCKSNNIGFRHRAHKDYSFYELLCLDCLATFAFGQRKEGGGLFPKGNDDGNWEPKYEGKGGHDRDDDRRDSRRDSRDEPRGRSTEREDDRRGRQQDERRGRTEAPLGREQPRPTADDSDDIPF